MNIAHPIQAVEHAPGAALAVRRVMAGALAAACAALLLAPQIALADPPPRDDARYAQRSERAAQQREDVRRFDPRAYEAREEQRRQQHQQQMDNHPDRRGGRLSADERRDLRRQINEAGMDIYPNAPRR